MLMEVILSIVVLFAPTARRLLVFYCFSERLIKHSRVMNYGVKLLL